MQTIGILGGMAPESTVEYYRQLIQASHEEGWEKRYPRTIIYSLNFEEFYNPLEEGNDDRVMDVLQDGITSLDRAGADFALLASNTPHKYLRRLEETSPIPLVSIVTATAEAARSKNYKRIGVLGTLFTTTGTFYSAGFENYDLTIANPTAEEKQWMHEKIFTELTNGVQKPETKQELIRIVERMAEDENLDAVALACTELPLLLDDDDLPVPTLNTTALHARYAFDTAIKS
jgi:aspartate racemase